MNGNPQGQDEIVINAPVRRIWEVVANSALLPQWMPMVKHVDVESSEAKVGVVRTCDIEAGEQKGQVTERCVEVVPQKKLSWVFDEENFGYARMLSALGFSVIL